MREATATEASGFHRHRLSVTLAALSCVVALAACGSSDKSNTAAASAGYSQFLKFSRCMRSHGLPKFPDPSLRGGIQLTPGSGLNPFSPAFKAAQADCHKLLPGGGPGQGPPSAEVMKQMLATSKCMRAHGVTGFPDPTTSPPSSPSGYSQIIGHGGAVIAVPDTIDASSPAYRRAAAACRFG